MRKFLVIVACIAVVGLATLIATPAAAAAKDNAAKEKAAKEKAAKEKAAKEKAAKEKAAKEKAAKEKAAKEKAAKEKAAKEKAAKEKHTKELAAKEKHAKELAAKEKHAKELAAKEKHAKEVAAKEKHAREVAAKEKGTHSTQRVAETNKRGTRTTHKGEHAAIYGALRLVHVANHNAKSAPKTYNRFGGHRNKAVDQMNRAIGQLEHALKHVKAPLPAKLTGIETSNMPIHHALKLARESLENAKGAAHDYGGHRHTAVEHLERTIKELHEGIKYFEAHPSK